MKTFITTSCLCLICALSLSAQHRVIPQDAEPQRVLPNIVVSGDAIAGNAVEIPTLPFPPEAKIQIWWPDDGAMYFMPNILGPHPSAEIVEWEPLQGVGLNPVKENG